MLLTLWSLLGVFLWLTLHAFSSPPTAHIVNETVEDAARIARGLLADTAIGTMATRYPADHPTLPGFPFSLQEYYASCYANGSLLLLFLPISRHSQNILKSPHHAASLSVWRAARPAADQARVSLVGNVTVWHGGGGSGGASAVSRGMRECYLRAHPDAARWLPGDPDAAHLSFWARFDPAGVYFVGGFGDEHYIGEIPLRMYQEARHDAGALRVQS